MSSEGNRMAGSRLVWLFTDPLGEEVLEGTMGGLMAGLPGLAADQSLGQTALQTATAIAGGIGVGALGRRLGARLGKRFHKEELKDQLGPVATISRLMGSETTAAGFGDQLRSYRSTIEDGLRSQGSAEMMRHAAADPVSFAGKYGLSSDEFMRLEPALKMGGLGTQAVEAMGRMKPEQRKQFVDTILDNYSRAEKAAGNMAADNLDEYLERAEKSARSVMEEDPDGAEKVRDFLGFDVADAMASLRQRAEPVTGEHVGRFAGRFIGDEIGIIGGMAAGGALASALGMQSPKDRRIEELERQLRQLGAS